MKEVILTPEGFKSSRRRSSTYPTTSVVRSRSDPRARQFGDIAENSEYDDARRQALLEHRTAVLEEKLAHARVIRKRTSRRTSSGSAPREAVGRVREGDGRVHIVGSAEANPAEYKLSNESPVGKAIMGKKKGETVEAQTPRGKPEVQDPRPRSRLLRRSRPRCARR